MLENPRHKTAVILGTLSHVPNYPKKLKIYLHNASPFWQAVYWDKGKTYRRSLKTTDKREAHEHAKAFYEHIILSKYQHPSHLAQHTISEQKPTQAVSPVTNHSFQQIASQWLSRKSPKWCEKHTKQVESRLENNILKYVAHKNIQRITRNELLGLLQ